MFLNGRRIRNGNNFKEAVSGNVKEHLHKGERDCHRSKNEGDAPNPAGVLALLKLYFAQPVVIASDEPGQLGRRPDWMNLDFDRRMANAR